MPILLALLTVVAGLVVGVVLFAAGHIIPGIVGCMAAPGRLRRVGGSKRQARPVAQR